MYNNKQNIRKKEKYGMLDMKYEDCDALYTGQNGRKIEAKLKKKMINRSKITSRFCLYKITTALICDPKLNNHINCFL